MKYKLYAFLLVSLIAIGPLASSSLAHATSAADFNPANIISDGVFTNTTTMNVSQIQAFLNSKVPSCDTNGTQPASDFGHPEMTHAQYAASQGWPGPPYPCLRDYSENGTSSAQLIYNLSQQYQINPQVLIVTLQKESGIVADTWPLPSEYKTATGYGCPDSGPNNSANCSSQYYGLTNQLTHTAIMYHDIITQNPNWYSPYVVGSNFIQWKQIASCGGTNVNIANLATAALYDYTPYQPNAASLAAGYGQGDGCSSYGNRNFYLYFTDWFGPTHKAVIPGCTEATNTSLSCAWKVKNDNTGQEIVSIDYSHVDDLVNNQNGYSFLGKAFLVRNPVSPQTGNIPIYSVTVSGAPLITADKNEYQSLVKAGNQDNGIAFYADPAGSNTGYQVYRLNSSTYGHVWTSDSSAVQAYLAQGYTSEGTAFTALSPIAQEVAPASGQSLVYRFGNMPGNTHFWTTDIYERDSMISAGYRYEGIGWRASQSSTTVPVYRLYSPDLRQHLYTSDANEKNVLTGRNWTNEGVGWYENPSTSSGPVYRLYSPTTYEHFFTTDAYERSQLISNRVFNDEGVAWYQP